MTEREKVIRGLECCATNEVSNCIGCPYLGCTPEHYCFGKMANDALELMNDRTKDYCEWAKQVGAHTCATCKRRDCDCPIENEYALPMDGYCHLWDGRAT